MAEKLDSFEFSGNKRTGRRPKYPWDEWLNGATWKLERGIDFHVPAKSFRTSLYAQARKRGMALEYTISENQCEIVFRVLDKEEIVSEEMASVVEEIVEEDQESIKE